MSGVPVVYLLHGDDDFAIARFVNELEAKLGDPSLAAMNVTRLDGRTFNPDELLSIAGTIPFLTRRRIVILENPLACFSADDARAKFLKTLEGLPPTTALVLVENRPLTDERDRKRGKVNWLESWAASAGDRVLMSKLMLPKVVPVQWIQDRARELGGQFHPKAAAELAGLVGSDTRRAEQEIEKLLAYVNYRRPVEAEDVQILTADTAEKSIFDLVDAIGMRDEQRAVQLLHRMLEQEEPNYIFPMVVRQFRLLLITREVLDSGGSDQEVARILGTEPYKVKFSFVAEKISRQARQFTMSALEKIYRRLLELDNAMKTSKMDEELALDTLVAGLAFMPR